MNAMVSYLVFLSVLVSYINSIMVVLGPNKKSFCAVKNFPEESILKMSYVVSGENEKIIKGVLTNEKDVELFSKEEENNGQYHLEVKESGHYKLCFYLKEDAECIVSFDYVNHLETSHITKLAKDDAFSKMSQNLTDISEMFDEMEKGLKFYVERSEAHNRGILYI